MIHIQEIHPTQDRHKQIIPVYNKLVLNKLVPIQELPHIQEPRTSLPTQEAKLSLPIQAAKLLLPIQEAKLSLPLQEAKGSLPIQEDTKWLHTHQTHHIQHIKDLRTKKTSQYPPTKDTMSYIFCYYRSLTL